MIKCGTKKQWRLGVTVFLDSRISTELVDPGGFEPPTFSMPLRRAPNCAMGPVDLRGFEPLTFSVRLRRAPKLRYRPKEGDFN